MFSPGNPRRLIAAQSLILIALLLMLSDGADDSNGCDDSDEGLAPPLCYPTSEPPLPSVAYLQNPESESSDALFEDSEVLDEDNEMEIDEFASSDDGFEEGDEFPPWDDDVAEKLPIIPIVDHTEQYTGDSDFEIEVEEDDESVDEFMNTLIKFAAQERELTERIERMREYESQIPSSADGFEELKSWPSIRFDDTFGMSSRTFWDISALLQDNPIFQSKGGRSQRPVSVQLACSLFRRGGWKARDASATLSISAGTVSTYCKRVTRALRELDLERAVCLNEETRRKIQGMVQESLDVLKYDGAGDSFR